MGFVYVLSNDSMPGLVKIGSTERSVQERISELSSTTGVPTAFSEEISILVGDHYQLEMKIHEDLSEYRVRDQREFFRMSVEDACEYIREIQIDNFLIDVVHDWSSKSIDKLMHQIHLAFGDHSEFKRIDELNLSDASKFLEKLPDEKIIKLLEDIFRKRPNIWKQIR